MANSNPFLHFLATQQGFMSQHDAPSDGGPFQPQSPPKSPGPPMLVDDDTPPDADMDAWIHVLATQQGIHVLATQQGVMSHRNEWSVVDSPWPSLPPPSPPKNTPLRDDEPHTPPTQRPLDEPPKLLSKKMLSLASKKRHHADEDDDSLE